MDAGYALKMIFLTHFLNSAHVLVNWLIGKIRLRRAFSAGLGMTPHQVQTTEGRRQMTDDEYRISGLGHPTWENKEYRMSKGDSASSAE